MAAESDAVDKMNYGARGTLDGGNVRPGGNGTLILLILFCSALTGCASVSHKPLVSGHVAETSTEQLDAAKKVMGAVAGGRDVTPADMKRVVRDIRTNPEAQSAVQAIVGTAGDPVVKYSPVTGKHYSGDLEYDPETGAKLEVIKE